MTVPLYNLSFAKMKILLVNQQHLTHPKYREEIDGLHHDYTTRDRYSDGEIEQSTQKTTWIQDTQSGILQVRRCTSNLNPRIKE
jgi:hypothetical protein